MPRIDAMITETPDRILRLPEVLRSTSFSRSTLYRKISGESFPHQITISARSIG